MNNVMDNVLAVWINRFGIHTPICFLTDIHILNNLRFLKRKGLRMCEQNSEDFAYWQKYMPNIFYAVLEEADNRGLDYSQILGEVYAI